MKKHLPFWCLIFAVSQPTVSTAREIIVSREDNAVAVFFQLPYAEVASLFGRRVQGFTDDAGHFERENLFAGTFDHADDLVADVTFDLGPQSVPFEALSMMIHQTATDVPFETPLDAEIAIAVCGVPFPEGPLAEDKVVWIGGWYAYPVDPDQALTIRFPTTGRASQTIDVKSFDKGRHVETVAMTVADGGALVVDATSRWSWLPFGG